MDQSFFFVFIALCIISLIAVIKRKAIRERWRRYKHPKIWVTLIKPYNIIEVIRIPFVHKDQEDYVFEWSNEGRHLVINKDAKTWAWRLEKKKKCFLQTPIIDYELGKSVNLNFDPALYGILSNPILSGQLTDAVMIKEAFGIKPSMRKKIVFAIVFFLLGYIFIGTIIRGFMMVFHVG
jgi:hypothetical protein